MPSDSSIAPSLRGAKAQPPEPLPSVTTASALPQSRRLMPTGRHWPGTPRARKGQCRGGSVLSQSAGSPCEAWPAASRVGPARPNHSLRLSYLTKLSRGACFGDPACHRCQQRHGCGPSLNTPVCFICTSPPLRGKSCRRPGPSRGPLTAGNARGQPVLDSWPI